jgi:Flp pilus assembly protein TadG
MLSPFTSLSRKLAGFKAASHGNVTILFALSMIPVFGLVGAAVDYSRANSARSAMQAAVDATALMLCMRPVKAALRS